MDTETKGWEFTNLTEKRIKSLNLKLEILGTILNISIRTVLWDFHKLLPIM